MILSFMLGAMMWMFIQRFVRLKTNNGDGNNGDGSKY